MCVGAKVEVDTDVEVDVEGVEVGLVVEAV